MLVQVFVCVGVGEQVISTVTGGPKGVLVLVLDLVVVGVFVRVPVAKGVGVLVDVCVNVGDCVLVCV